MRLSRLLPAFLAIGVSLVFFACEDRTTGTSDEHETSLARLYRTDGSPAARAKLKFYSVSDTAQAPIAQTYTTESGAIQLPELPAGLYNAVASSEDGTAALIDSIVYAPSGKASVLSDTLKPMSVVRGRVVVQPQHSPQIAWIQVMGMGVAANVDSLGRFKISLPAGRATIYALTREAQYTPTFCMFVSKPSDTLDLGVIELIYTGIPVVTGVTVVYDSLHGEARIHWERSSSVRVAYYRVERNDKENSSSTTWTLQASEPTAFIDALFTSSTLRLKPRSVSYSVVALDSGSHPGLDWIHVPLEATSPYTLPISGLDLRNWGKLPDDCRRLDTLAQELVCLNGGPWDFGINQADSLRFWRSTDGKVWSPPLALPGLVMRAVPWKGGIWVLRGLPSGTAVRREAWFGSNVFSLLSGVVLERWSLDGKCLRKDTLSNPQGIIGHRLIAHGDTLLMSLDTVFGTSMGATGPNSFVHMPVSVRALVGGDGSWINLPKYPFPAEYTTSDNTRLINGWGLSDSWADWSKVLPDRSVGGLAISHFGDLVLVSEPDRAIPWAAAATSQFIYRGDGATVPGVLAWQGCGIFPSGSDLMGICPRP